MSGVGFWELTTLFFIGLMVLGPERLPRVASQLGSWVGQARRMTRMMRRQLEDELNLEAEPALHPHVTPEPQSSEPQSSEPQSSEHKFDDSVGAETADSSSHEYDPDIGNDGTDSSSVQNDDAPNAEAPDTLNPERNKS